VKQCSAKDAIACAKTLTAMMTDLQSGKPASVGSSVGRGPVPRRSFSENENGGPRVAALQPESLLNDALASVLSSDQESHIPEPHMRFIARADRLCKEVRKRLHAAQSSPNPVGGANQRRSCRGNSRIALGGKDCPRVAIQQPNPEEEKSRANQPGVLGGDSPVGRDPCGAPQNGGGQATRPTDASEIIFDAGKLHAQLADLLKLYLARAADPDAIEKCSAKDALACAKALTAMMSDLQSGKPASVDKGAEWRRCASTEQAPQRVRGADQRRSYGGDCPNTPKSRASEPFG
jgi:hypothetical protein